MNGLPDTGDGRVVRIRLFYFLRFVARTLARVGSGTEGITVNNVNGETAAVGYAGR